MTSIVAPVMAAGLILAACGGSESSGETTNTIELTAGETDYKTIPPPTVATTTPETETSAPESGSGSETGGAAAGETTYTIMANDYPSGIASSLGVSLDDLASVNGWTDCGANGCTGFPGIGTTIQVPAGASSPSESAEPDDSSDSGDSGTSGDSGEAIEDPGDNCDEGSYTVESGDTPNAVANNFGVSFADLQAANPSVDFTSTFGVGLDIVIPAKDDC